METGFVEALRRDVPTPVFIFDPPPFTHFCWGIYEELEMYTGGGNGVQGQLQPALNEPIETRNHLKKRKQRLYKF